MSKFAIRIKNQHHINKHEQNQDSNGTHASSYGKLQFRRHI